MAAAIPPTKKTKPTTMAMRWWCANVSLHATRAADNVPKACARNGMMKFLMGNVGIAAFRSSILFGLTPSGKGMMLPLYCISRPLTTLPTIRPITVANMLRIVGLIVINNAQCTKWKAK